MVASALALSACGGGGDTSTAPKPTEATIVAPSASPAVAKPAGFAHTRCAEHLKGFVAELEHLRRSLAIGVSYEQYVSELRTLRKSYQRVPVGELDLACVSGPANAAERSFDRYLAAANTWGACVAEPGCETAALEPKLQRAWRAAAKRLATAQRALEAG